MENLTINDKGTPKEMRARVLNLIKVMEQGYISISDFVEIALRIVEQYNAHPYEQEEMLLALNKFIDRVIAA